MIGKFKIGDRVSYPMNGKPETGRIWGMCSAPSNAFGPCYVIESDVVGNVHRREEVLMLQDPQQDDAADIGQRINERLDQIVDAIKALQTAGGGDLAEPTPPTAEDAQNPSPKFKVGDGVRVARAIGVGARSWVGMEGVVTTHDVAFEPYPYEVVFEGEKRAFGEDELEEAPARSLEAQDREYASIMDFLNDELGVYGYTKVVRYINKLREGRGGIWESAARHGFTCGAINSSLTDLLANNPYRSEK